MGKPGEVASLRTPKGLFVTHISFVSHSLVFMSVLVSCTHKFRPWGGCACVCVFTMGVVCEKPAQSETGIHPFPALVSECLGQ